MADREGRFSGNRLFYRIWRASPARAVAVLAHGYAEHSGRYEHVGRALVGAGLATFALDHHGHGQSEGERANIRSVADAVADLDAFVDLATSEVPGVPVFLVGHSMGGLIAVAYAEVHESRLAGLAVSGPALVLNPAFEAMEAMDEIPDLPLGPLVSRDPLVVADYESDPLNYHGPFPRDMIRAFAEIKAVRDSFSLITIPVLAMHGEADALVAPQASEDLAAGVSSEDVTLRIWPGLYHEIWNEPEKEETVGALVEWITRRVPRVPRVP